MRTIFFIPILLLTLLSGCVASEGVFYSSDKAALFGEAKYAQIIEEFESSGDSFEHLPDGDLWAVCGAYVQINNFDRTFTCLDHYRSRVAIGQYNFTGIGDSRAYERIWYGQAKLALGDAQAALDAAAAAEHIRQVAGNEYFNTKMLQFEALSLEGLANLQLGNKAAVKQQIAEIEAISTSGVSILMTTHKHQVLASLKFGLGDYQAALVDSRQRKSLLMRGWDDGGLQQYALPSLYIEARSLLAIGDTAAAKQKYDALLLSGRISEVGSIYWISLVDRARIANEEGSLQESINYLESAVQVIESQRTTIDAEASKIGFAGDTQTVYGQLVKQLIETGDIAKAFEYTERGKARALVDMLASKERFRRQNRENESTINQFISDLAENDKNQSMSAYKRASPNQPQSIGTSAKTRGISVELANRLIEFAPQLTELVTVVPSNTTDLQRRIAEDETLVEFYGVDDDLIQFVVTNRAIQVRVIPASELESTIRQFRQAITDKNQQLAARSGDQLYQQLFAPIQGHLTEKLIVVPHGPLHYLPFNALTSGENYLIDRHTIRLLPSASVLKFLPTKSTKPSLDILAMGNPDLGNREFDLPGAESEVRAIAAKFSSTKLLLGSDATETNLKQYGSQFPYLHFAMHGTFDAQSPLTSGLLMAADHQNDGVLTVAELYDLNLPASLVTLSACETAMGSITNGDDVIGFTRGFLFAGAETIISSLWKVDDAATYFLMDRFYQYLPDHSKQKALRLAQIDTRAKFGESAFYWAAFQLNGAG